MPNKVTGERTKRTTRLSDRETERRMLEAARNRVDREGLSVSFDALGYEELISDAGVARSAAYRKWPSRELYYADLMRELTRLPHPFAGTVSALWSSHAERLLDESPDVLRRDQGRRQFFVEFLRRTCDALMQEARTGVSWGNFRALQVARKTLTPGSELLHDVTEGLEASVQAFESELGECFAALLTLCGVQLREDFDYFTTAHLARVVPEMLDGMLDHCTAYPRPLNERFVMDPLRTGRREEWQLSTLGIVNAIVLYVEPSREAPAEWGGEERARRVAAFHARVAR
ncbi:hypothetical protein JT358_09780 [Micrococcales bacterium 31B]|nr:hypothetical protein [Micrococcales bacterium 31B]